MNNKRKASEEEEERPVKRQRKQRDNFLFELFAGGRGIDLNEEINTVLKLIDTTEKQTHKVWRKTLLRARDEHKDETTKQFVIMYSLMQMKSYRDMHGVDPAKDLRQFEHFSNAYVLGHAVNPHQEVTNKTPSEDMIRTKDVLMFHARNHYLHV
jgi:hypothetical protein